MVVLVQYLRVLSMCSWKPVSLEEYSHYQVSDKGEIKNSKDHVLKPAIGDGYNRVELFSNGQSRSLKVHRIVALAFIPNPENKPFVNHKDGNKLNNCVENLEWVTQSENTEHFLYTLGKGCRNKGRVVEKWDKDKKILIATYETREQAARAHNVNSTTINGVIDGKKTRKPELMGFVWKYADVFDEADFTDIPGYPGYKISKDGRILTILKKVKSKLLRPSVQPSGYSSVCLQPDGKRHNLRVHRLVALTFIPNPDNKPLVNHKDGNKTNNHVDNLEWVSAKENCDHAYDTNLRQKTCK